MTPPSAPDILYKYYAPARTDCLTSKTVRFSQLSALNDPFEFFHAFDGPGLKTQFQDMLERAAKEKFDESSFQLRVRQETEEALSNPAIQAQLRRLPSQQRAIAVARLRAEANRRVPELRQKFEMEFAAAQRQILNDLPEMFQSVIENTVRSAVLFCASEEPLSAPMWAHYTANHSGFQIGFDPKTFLPTNSGDKRSVAMQVIYQNQAPVFGTNFDESDFFRRKSMDWAYEREWRYIDIDDSLSHGSEDAIILRAFNPASIREITLGLSSTQALRASVLAIAQSSYPCVNLYQCTVSSRSFRIERTPL